MTSTVLDLAASHGLELGSPEFAAVLDEADELRSMRERFHIPPVDPTAGAESARVVYLCGNSLGCQPKNTSVYVNQELEAWQRLGVEGHWDAPRPWLTTDEFVYKLMAHVVGALDMEVAIMNSLTANLHLMMVPFYRPTAERHKILIEYKAFPSDLYAVESQIKFHGYDPATSLIQLRARDGEAALRNEDILEAIEREGDSIALVMLSGVQYYTGQLFRIADITAAAHKKGCVVGFDLAHAVGNVVLRLHEWNVDWAVWCNYKYINAGPGAIGGCFVHERHALADLTQFSGWWGHDLKTRFDMDAPFTPIAGAFRFRLSNPPVLQVAALLASLELFEEATMERLRAKSERLTAYLELLLDRTIDAKHLSILTPRTPQDRGCQLSLFFHDEHTVKRVNSNLQKNGCVCDYRKPNVIRVAPVPLYNSFSDVQRFVSILRQSLEEQQE